MTHQVMACTTWRPWIGRTAVLLPFGLVLNLLVGCAKTTAVRHAPQALDYTQWRGRTRDGAASAFVPPSRWPAQLTRRWKVEVGEGYATPLVVDRIVYTFTRRDGREVMTALDAATGRTRWQTGYDAPYAPSQPASAHGAGPKATPLFHDGSLYTLGVSGIVAAFDAKTGALRWHTPPPAEAPFFNAAASPIGDGGLVLTHPGNYGPLTAIDTKSGRIAWTAGDNGFFASPIIVSLDGVRQAVTVTQSQVIGVSLADGGLLWAHPWSGGAGGISPLAHGDTIIVSGLNLGVTAFRPFKRSDGTWTTETKWETKDVSMYISNPVIVGDTLYGLSHRSSGQFFALDVTTGTVLWQGPPRAAKNTAIAKAGSLLFLLNDDGELIVAQSSRTGFEPLQRYTVADSATWAQPAISGNRLFIKDVTSLTLWTLD
jgi:outer membrane protein assembly factor BamB